MIAQNKALTRTGWGIAGLLGLMMIASAAMKLANSQQVLKEMVGRLGYPADVTRILGVVEIACIVLYLIPRTSVLGAVLLTGYLGAPLRRTFASTTISSRPSSEAFWSGLPSI